MLLVVTNCGEIPSIKRKTGWYLPEVAHPYKVFKEAGISMTVVSPLGGMAPVASIFALIKQYSDLSLSHYQESPLLY